MKKFLVVLFVVAFVCTALVAVAQEKGAAQIKLDKAKMGVVTFEHAQHQSLTDCKTCHHTGTYAACDSCHGDKADGKKLDYKKAIHENCQGCHKKEGKGPTKCKECHVK